MEGRRGGKWREEREERGREEKGWREGGKEGGGRGREGGKGGMEGGREGGREMEGREGWRREGGKEGGMEGGREGGREGGSYLIELKHGQKLVCYLIESYCPNFSLYTQGRNKNHQDRVAHRFVDQIHVEQATFSP